MEQLGSVVLVDIAVGDLFLFSGQSNIDIPESYGHQFNATAQAEEEAWADAHGAAMRLLIIPHAIYPPVPQKVSL
eukprot:COSAG05_NODE_19577_length_290_cov_1.089005_1_plen_74_part_01